MKEEGKSKIKGTWRVGKVEMIEFEWTIWAQGKIKIYNGKFDVVDQRNVIFILVIFCFLRVPTSLCLHSSLIFLAFLSPSRLIFLILSLISLPKPPNDTSFTSILMTEYLPIVYNTKVQGMHSAYYFYWAIIYVHIFAWGKVPLLSLNLFYNMSTMLA